ncbi:MAG: N-6 DNA methylase, partial [Chloroflexaceae bacterium]|nr:N-6 DNA methylase [Chloroflexaceae bacterium]
MSPITAFLTSLEADLKRGNATEHTYRAAIERLFEQVLAGIEAINEPTRAEYGAPDFVLQDGQTPIGHVEAKDVDKPLQKWIKESEGDAPKSSEGKQFKRYRAALGNLLITDGLEWHWFVGGEARTREPVRVATWDVKRKRLRPTPNAEPELLTLLAQFRAQQVPTISTPRDLAARLAQLALWLRDAINQVFASEESGGDLHSQYEAFRELLLPTLTYAEFADMYAQTLVYGLFAARVAQPDVPQFDRDKAEKLLPATNPFLRNLFRQISGSDLDERIAWLVDDCAQLLARTDMSAVLRDFGKATRQEDPVVHFYETFLAAYDPRMREARGVYYTPEPVVGYIVRSVDALLRRDFGRAAGLADPQTLILDPATGTATFLHAVVQQIYRTLEQQGMAGQWNSYVPEQLLPRLFGFELLMAPYTVAHLKLGLLLQQYGYTFGSKQRLAIYLTNTLGDAPPQPTLGGFGKFIADEGAAAEQVKRDKPVMVVLGNPPYSGHSENKGAWINTLIREYFQVDGAPLGERNPKWLNDDYVKFIRFGQWRITQTGEGVLAYISNNGYLDNPTFRGMRQSLLHSFSTIYILNLRGNSKKKERAPDGGPDENVFDIQQGVAIGIFVKDTTAASPPAPATVYYADLWGERAGKYALLAATDVTNTEWHTLTPDSPYYLFVPQDTDIREEYLQGWGVPDVFGVNSVGIVTARDSLTIHLSQQELVDTVNTFARLPVEEARQTYQLGKDVRDWRVADAQTDLQLHIPITKDRVTIILYRPFDMRYSFYTGTTTGFMCMPRPAVMRHMLAGANVGVCVGRAGLVIDSTDDWNILYCSDSLTEFNLFRRGGNNLFPLYLYPTEQEVASKLYAAGERRVNMSEAFIGEVAQRTGWQWVGVGRGDLVATVGAEDVFHYIYAVLHSPTYRTRYAEFLKIDFPRVPITRDPAAFRTLASYGAQLVDLHLLRLPAKNAARVGRCGRAAAADQSGGGGAS